ncbi:ComEA family DNA-binding protein [Dactylosporangium vinaceum]|uniref:Helix-hairpin-helix domain-containing protein n=1 Tax=Dactylosporangium vinaceum TaxID=53362 RepID=A0ABV5M5K9_9ACTN|nr:ComEA family DNA-binding protein [Dactylosporangium vinaceum]UAB95596.1 ComEA family DNA-binding protein [Dactylosporangium vinaceum]
MWRSEDDEDAGPRGTELPGGDDNYPWDKAPEERRRPWTAFDPQRPGARVLLVVAVVVVVAAAAVYWFSRPHVTSAPALGAASAPADPGVSPSPAVLIVSVIGKVNRPGLVRLPAGSRVADAIEAAGGVAAGVDLGGLNLARKVVDGEMIAVGVTPPPVAPLAPGGAGPTAGGLVNINTASPAELQTLPGIGEVLAQRILDYRDAHGGFRAVTDLRQVEGIGEAKFKQLKDRVTV